MAGSRDDRLSYMGTTKIAAPLEADIAKEIDQWVHEGHFANRGRAIQAVLAR
jgi:hypothetical protein